MNPAVHYLRFGAAERRDPHPLFDTDWYLAQNPDVAEAGMNPAVHYLRFGATEGRDPNPLFDTDWYLARNLDVAEAGLNNGISPVRRAGREQPGLKAHARGGLDVEGPEPLRVKDELDPDRWI